MQPLSNADTFGHLAQGRVIAANGGPPALDPFSFWRPTPQPWVNYEWLSDWLTWLVLSALGAGGVIAIAMGIAGGSGAALVWLAGRRAGLRAAWLASWLTILAIPAVRFRLSARPHLVALPFAAAYLAIFTSDRAFADRRRAGRSIALLIVLHVLWTNLHGSHLLGLAIAGASAIAAWPDRRRAAMLAGTTGLLALASCVSPYGPAMTIDALSHALDPAYAAVVSEWQSIATLGVGWTTVHVALHVLALIAIAPAAIRAGAATRTWLAVALLLVVAGVRSVRFVEEMLLLGAPLVAIGIATMLGARADVRPAVVAMGTIAALAIASLGVARTSLALQPIGVGLDLRQVPAEAGAHVDRELGEARVLASMPSAWYLLHAAPHARVAIDGRVPFYGPAHVQASTDALGTEGALLPYVERFGVDTIVVHHTSTIETAAVRTLPRDPRFVRTWIDASYAVYVRRDLAAARGIDPARLDALPVGYEPAAILGASDAQVAAIREDLGHLGEGPDARAFAAFVRAMLRVRPLARDAGWAGYRAPIDDAERASVDLAHRELALTRARIGRVPVVAAQSALVAALACRLDEARTLLDEARRDGEVRETIFGGVELALRDGDRDAVRAFLVEARAMPGAAGDPWIAAIDRALSEGVSCAER
ncbi:Hypothetical protein I5071_84700 [Sandaracinus amylolyticus]|nr:Hypothetical protein I5071_84700 [Sandaracinus amylolyticus]